MDDCVKERVYALLNKMGIDYDIVNHPPMFTIEDMNQANLQMDCVVCKNLFLRDAKGKQHYLVMLSGEKQINLKSLANKLDSTNLSFASEERLMKYLGLKKGSVSPFGVINDADHHTIVVIDDALKHCAKIGVHPNINTASVILKCADIIKIIEYFGNKLVFLEL